PTRRWRRGGCSPASRCRPPRRCTSSTGTTERGATRGCHPDRGPDRADPDPRPLRGRHDQGRPRHRARHLHPRRDLQRLRRHLSARRLPTPGGGRAQGAVPGRAPGGRAGRGPRHRGAAPVLRRPDEPRHAHRLVHRHLRAHRRRVAHPDPLHDVPAAQRRTGRRSPADQLAPEEGAHASLDGDMAQLSKVKRLAYDAGWMRWGWPERVGGLGGSPLLRGYLGEALTTRGLVEPGIYSMTEVLAPTMIDHADPALAAEMVPRLLRGDETWCQGFSEPGTGSNLAALGCRATRVRSGAGEVWRVDGQKVWTSLAQYAHRCVLLVRTGTVEEAHRGISALFVDMDSPGVTVRPIGTMHGRPEFCEVFFDEVEVPGERMLGRPGDGW